MKIVTADLFEKAILYAAKKHKGQRRKGDGSPYIVHPMYVMTLVSNLKKDSKNLWYIATATILHDVCEDCGISIKKIAKKFGHHVAALVQELTLDKSKYETIGKTEYLCQHMAGMSSYALTIKLCDRYHNITDMSKMAWDFQKTYAQETNTIISRVITDRDYLSTTQLKLIDMIREQIKPYI